MRSIKTQKRIRGGTEMFKNLLAEMTRAGIQQKEMAKKIGIRPATFSVKMNGKTEWRVSEMTTIQEVINKELGTSYTLDYLFEA